MHDGRADQQDAAAARSAPCRGWPYGATPRRTAADSRRRRSPRSTAERDIEPGSRPARDICCSSTTMPRKQLSRTMPTASTTSISAAAATTARLSPTPPTHFRLPVSTGHADVGVTWSTSPWHRERYLRVTPRARGIGAKQRFIRPIRRDSTKTRPSVVNSRTETLTTSGDPQARPKTRRTLGEQGTRWRERRTSHSVWASSPLGTGRRRVGSP